MSYKKITDLPTLVDKYESELTRVLDIHVPEKKRTIMVRPAAAWYKALAQIMPGY